MPREEVPRPARSSLALVAGGGPDPVSAATSRRRSPPTSRAPSRSTRAARSGCSACRRHVDTVEPSGTDVVVTMSYDAEVKLPADAQAVIIAPSLVGDRFVQLTPAYHGRARSSPTARCSTSTGPPRRSSSTRSTPASTSSTSPSARRRQQEGRADRPARVTAANFGGQGAQFHQTIKDFSKLSATLDDNKEELFGSAEELEGFIEHARRNDQTVREFNQSLAGVSTMLAGERQELRGRRCATSAWRWARSRASSRRTARSLEPQHLRAQPGLQGAGQAARRPRRDPQRRPGGAQQPRAHLQPAGRHARHPRQPSASSLNQIEADPAAFLCGFVSQVDTLGQVCDVIKQAARQARGPVPSAGRRAARRRTASTRPSADSWRRRR